MKKFRNLDGNNLFVLFLAIIFLIGILVSIALPFVKKKNNGTGESSISIEKSSTK